jgi:hypothetical protein
MKLPFEFKEIPDRQAALESGDDARLLVCNGGFPETRR